MSTVDRTDVGRWPPAAVSNVSRQPSRVTPSEVPTERKKSFFERCCGCCSRQSVDDDAGVYRGHRPVDRERPDEMLVVTSVDLMKQRNGPNRSSHHTNEFEYDDLIVRRGQPFQMCLTLRRPFDPDYDHIILQFLIGNAPQESKGTMVRVPQVREFDSGQWGCQAGEASGNQLTLWVNTSATTPIGKWQILVRTQSPGGNFVMERDPKHAVYILFNPWCQLDSVYMSDESWKREYILNEIGRLYYGTEHQIGERSWNFGQFNRGILDACLYLLDRGGMPYPGRADPVSVCRVISALINSMDDNGVVAGDWSGDYSAGTNPTAWVGSVDILLRYHQTGAPVKFGQCWVFSGVCTTVLRCLGIPGRSITNFASAHDTDANLSLDVYFDKDMKPLEDKNTDSVWNYHVWNDCWMTRPDLPSGYDGWQALDATPQETSSGIYRCGPCPLPAIKNGLVYVKFDAPFIFAEVNSDKVYYQQQPDGSFKKAFVEEKAVGHLMSTKAVGSNAREDITHLYKYPEGSPEERRAVMTALQYSGIKPSAIEAPEPGAPETRDRREAPDAGPEPEVNPGQDVHVTIEAQDGVVMGNDMNVRVIVKNNSTSQRHVALCIRVAAMYYTGVCRSAFKEVLNDVTLGPGEAKPVSMILRHSEYQNQLVDQGAMMLTVSGDVRETGQTVARQFSFRVRTPDLSIKVSGEAQVGKQVTAEIMFKNPLNQVLHDCKFHVEGPGLQRPKVVNVGNVGPLKSVSIIEKFTPTRPGPRQFIASFESIELSQIHGVTDVIVRDA
ncbi:protein-glutamine gamma-glutamyltransferase K isoform X2 [Ambystoma mexicanum]|uniref:protein-glutamine gamma-glutamyltransferase K isoform X2 n=1 Tax=Ambystoma mexicanum TaxID=8296 RepID=UPI0037E8ABE5